MRKHITALLLVTFSSCLFAADYQSEIDNFFSYYEKGDVENAISSIYSSNPYISSVPDQIKAVRTQLSSVKGLVGNINSIQKVDTYSVSDVFVHVTYIVTYDRQPLRFEFQFFKANEGWRIYSFAFDQDFNDDVETLARKRALSTK